MLHIRKNSKTRGKFEEISRLVNIANTCCASRLSIDGKSIKFMVLQTSFFVGNIDNTKIDFLYSISKISFKGKYLKISNITKREVSETLIYLKNDKHTMLIAKRHVQQNYHEWKPLPLFLKQKINLNTISFIVLQMLGKSKLQNFTYLINRSQGNR